MEYSEFFNSRIHYHIRWSDSLLDWKPFATEEEAKNLAENIQKPNETYVIVECDSECQRCKEFKLRAVRPTLRPAA